MIRFPLPARLAAAGLAAALLAACAGAPGTAPYDPATDPMIAGGRPGAIVYSDTWKPGWSYDMDDGKYYYIVPPPR